MSVNGWIDSWICENQPRSNLRILKQMVEMAVGFADTNPVPTFVDHSPWLDGGCFCENQARSNCRILKFTAGMTVGFRKPTVFQPSYLKAHCRNDGWIDENQPFPNPHT